MPVISIIIPVYNGGKYIQRCLNSIVSQDFSDYELLIIDDGSTDSSGEICNYYASKYDNVEVVHIPNGGVSNARNLGMSSVDGEYIMFVDADDELMENALIKVSDRIKKDNKPDLLIFDNCVKYVDGSVCYPHKNVSIDKVYTSNELYEGYLQARIGTSFPAPWGRVYRADIIKEFNLRFDSKLRRNEDEVFNCNFLSLIKTLSLSSDVLYVYYNTPNSAVSIFYGYEIEYNIMATANANRKLMLKLTNGNEEKAHLHYENVVAHLLNLHICVLYANSVKNKKKWLKYIVDIGENFLSDDFPSALLRIGKFRAKFVALFYKQIIVLHVFEILFQLVYKVRWNLKFKS